MDSQQKISVFRATEADDAELCRILREIPMSGHVKIRFTREPSYFAAARVEGEAVEVAAAGEFSGGHIVGFGARAEKQCFVNGCLDWAGYLSGLRLEKAFRKGLLVAKGYKLLREMDLQGRARLYLTTIVESNKPVLQLLSSGKAGLPAYHDAGRIVTLALRARRVRSRSSIAVRPALEEDLAALIDFWQQEGPRRQFFPYYQARHFTEKQGLLQGLNLNDILIARQNGEITGTLGLWDQSRYKQSWVDGYSTLMQWLRPGYNAFARIAGRPRLPSAGQQIHYRTVALVCIRNDAKYVMDALLRTALNRAAADKNLHSIAVAFHQDDPLLPVARQWPHFAYHSRLFVVHWPEAQEDWSRLDQRIPYLELGAL